MDTQSLTKLIFNLKIIPVTKGGFPIGVPFVAMFNPDSFTVNEDVSWVTECSDGRSGAEPTFRRGKPRKFTLEFTLDGTGVNTNGAKIPVTAQIAFFRASTTAVQGHLHRPNYLIVQYGTFINLCVLNSSNVTYTMFDMVGLPIRAKVSATFTERTPDNIGAALAMLSSPDLTHSKIVKQWDILPLLTHEVYNNQDYELQVAKANKLKNFRKLEAGSTLIFPPIASE